MANEIAAPHPKCNGCSKLETCEKAKSLQALSMMNDRRAPSRVKYFICHSIFRDVAARPPDDKATRRNFGEGAVHY